jgi:diguanylate cyclase (GGDEF)-like protein/PAS domain S-box-containing protein
MVAEQANTILQPSDIPEMACYAIAESSPIPMAQVEGPGHILRYVNPAFCLLSSKSKEELIGSYFWESTQEGQDCLTLLDRVYESGQALTHVRQQRFSSQSLYRSYSIWPISAKGAGSSGIIVQIIEEASAYPEEVAASHQASIVGQAHQTKISNLSEKLHNQLQVNEEIETSGQTLEALVGSHKRYQDLYDFAPIGYLTLDTNGSISEININGALLLGEVRPRLLGSPFVRYVTHDDLKRYCGYLKKVINQGKRQTFDLALKRKDGSVFHVQFDCVRSIAEDTQPLVRITIIDITQRKRSESEIEQLALYDSLTQLPNRRLLFSRLKTAVTMCSRTMRHGAVLFIDLDDFKSLNDTQGHFVGDLLLQQVALRLSRCVREDDTVARLGGDEFVVMLSNLGKNPSEAATHTKKIGEKLLAALNEPYLLAGCDFRISGSIGTTLFNGDKDGLEEILKRADLAVYCAKKAGRNTLRFFDPEMHIAAKTRAVLDGDLRRALREKQLVLFYQAQVDRDGELIGAEALVRWQHPERGLVSPAEFIPFAEESGLIEFVGQWVLETACSQLLPWSRTAATAGLRLAINVSAHEFCRQGFVTRSLDTIDRYGIDPRKLMFELTESAMFTTVDETFTKMTELKARGIGFSIDDFGIGYSSLSYLKNMPLDQLKLDRSFITDILTNSNDAAIARTIIALGQSLNIEVIAEGVENEGQRKFLTIHGCNAYQGFLFGRPGTVEELFLKERRNLAKRNKSNSARSQYDPIRDLSKFADTIIASASRDE